MGYTVPIDMLDSYVVIIKPSLSIKDIGLTLAHEMVHVKQYFRKELDGSNCRFKWKGRNADGYKYENQPWEREAFRRESDLYQKCWPL